MAKRIFIFEDNETVRNLLTEILGSQGFEVTAFHDAAIAENERHIRELVTEADFIISDIEMPGISGIELVRKLIRAGFDEKHIALISGYCTEDEIPEELRATVKFFRKPFSTVSLICWLEGRKGG
ncbi:MAG: response regulator [Desulfococcaceae bacterium]|jgi:DNA-binding NtrC family response regulator|nr:response regulator [Desulfococcaceae bacterium]